MRSVTDSEASIPDSCCDGIDALPKDPMLSHPVSSEAPYGWSATRKVTTLAVMPVNSLIHFSARFPPFAWVQNSLDPLDTYCKSGDLVEALGELGQDGRKHA